MPTVTRALSSDSTVGELVTLSDEAAHSKVVICPRRGALVTSFKVEGTELLYLDEATLRDENQNVRGGIPVLFPSPGKLDDDTWKRAGHTGHLKQHGFARNLAWSVSDFPSASSTATTASVTLSLESSITTLPQYPWAFHAELTFTLAAKSLRIASRIRNDSATSMPYALGYHPYFLVSDKTRIRIDTQATLAFDNVQKRKIPFQGFDFTREEVDLHLLDHKSSTSTLHLGDDTCVRVSASPDFVRWVVWSRAGKDFVCLEPWTAPGNALNTSEHLFDLPAGAEQTAWIEIARD